MQKQNKTLNITHVGYIYLMYLSVCNNLTYNSRLATHAQSK